MPRRPLGEDPRSSRRDFLRSASGLALALPAAGSLFSAAAPGRAAEEAPARGLLRMHPDNPRYFTDGSVRAVYLTGAHTRNNLVDMGRGDPPGPFDFDAYHDFLGRHGHNFIRLWAWDSTTWDSRANGAQGTDFVHHVAPLPCARTGPGRALDGKPKFDLSRFDDSYFERLRDRTGAAGRRGTYVSVMLFEGWGLFQANRGRAGTEGWAWRGHPFHPENNVNGINADRDSNALGGAVHRLGNRAEIAIQAAYVRKVVDTVNDRDNVLYEVINEGGQEDWDWWVIETMRKHERKKPRQHPVGLSGHGAERLPSLLASPADWISTGRVDGYGEDPPAWEGNCLARPGVEYVVFLPEGGEVEVDLSGADGSFPVEWIHPVEGTITKGKPVAGGGKRALRAPLTGPAVLYLRKR